MGRPVIVVQAHCVGPAQIHTFLSRPVPFRSQSPSHLAPCPVPSWARIRVNRPNCNPWATCYFPQFIFIYAHGHTFEEFRCLENGNKVSLRFSVGAAGHDAHAVHFRINYPLFNIIVRAFSTEIEKSAR